MKFKRTSLLRLKLKLAEAGRPVVYRIKNWRSPKLVWMRGAWCMRVTTRIWRGERSQLGVMMTVLRARDWEVHVWRVKGQSGSEWEWHYQGLAVWDDGRVYRTKWSCSTLVTEAKPLNEMFRERLGVTFITT